MAELSVKSLTARQAKALSALLTCSSLADAAQASGIPERTLYRYLRTPHFADCYREARGEQVRQAVAQMQRVAEKAAATLEAIMADPMAKPTARVMAARTVLDTALRAVEIENLEARLAAIEAKVETV